MAIKSEFQQEKFVGLLILRTILSQNEPILAIFKGILGSDGRKNAFTSAIVQLVQKQYCTKVRQKGENIGVF